MPPQVIDSFLPRELYERLTAFIEACPMIFGAKSNSQTDPHGHWSWKPFTDSTHNLADISEELFNIYPVPMPEVRDTWRFIKSKPDWPAAHDFKLIRCYANGYGYGEDGYFHTDSDHEGDATIIIYICDAWERDWAGETVVLDGKTYYSYLPHPNRCLVIPSNLPHAARAVSRKCTKLRRTLMFKTRPADIPEFEKLSKFLVSMGALKIKHAKGSLHDHLMRVFVSLWRNAGPPLSPTLDVAYGGGLHSIYGTNAFKQRLLEPHASNRAMVATMFGAKAEGLAFKFSLLDRPLELEKIAGWELPMHAPVGLQCSHADQLVMPMAEARQLCLIECVNLEDQGALAKSAWPKLAKFWSETTCKSLESERKT